MRIRLRDSEFAHAPESWNCIDKPKYIIWDRNLPDDNNGLTVFTDKHLKEAENSISKIKIAMLIEPEVIHNHTYNFIANGGYKLFNYVLTFQKNLLDVIPNGFRIVGSGSWFRESEFNIYDKTKNVSIIASNKRITNGHKFRHDIINYLKHKIDYICGNGYIPVDNKIVAFENFRYTIVVENSKVDYWFSEKIIDAFATGTIPIYWGCPSIGDFFDINGIINFDTMNDLSNILDSINEIDYKNRIDSINKNFNIAKNEYKVVEDWLYRNFFKNFDKGV